MGKCYQLQFLYGCTFMGRLDRVLCQVLSDVRFIRFKMDQGSKKCQSIMSGRRPLDDKRRHSTIGPRLGVTSSWTLVVICYLIDRG
jgi:hypothetical protein